MTGRRKITAACRCRGNTRPWAAREDAQGTASVRIERWPRPRWNIPRALLLERHEWATVERSARCDIDAVELDLQSAMVDRLLVKDAVEGIAVCGLRVEITARAGANDRNQRIDRLDPGPRLVHRRRDEPGAFKSTRALCFWIGPFAATGCRGVDHADDKPLRPHVDDARVALDGLASLMRGRDEDHDADLVGPRLAPCRACHSRTRPSRRPGRCRGRSSGRCRRRRTAPGRLP